MVVILTKRHSKWYSWCDSQRKGGKGPHEEMHRLRALGPQLEDRWWRWQGWRGYLWGIETRCGRKQDWTLTNCDLMMMFHWIFSKQHRMYSPKLLLSLHPMFLICGSSFETMQLLPVYPLQATWLKIVLQYCSHTSLAFFLCFILVWAWGKTHLYACLNTLNFYLIWIALFTISVTGGFTYAHRAYSVCESIMFMFWL